MTEPTDARGVTISPGDDDRVVDDDGLPHAPYDYDEEGVPYSAPTCGMDGEWWPCAEKRKQEDKG